MTSYRCVCPQCTAYIRELNVETMAEQDTWQERAEAWLREHVCGEDCGDGIERPSQYETMYNLYNLYRGEAMSLVDAEVQHDWMIAAQRVLQQLHNTEAVLILSIQDRPAGVLSAKLAETRRHIWDVERKIRQSQTDGI